MARILADLNDSRSFAGELAAKLGPKTILNLSGPMGAGKTQLTQFIVEALGGAETASPSFAIHNSYAVNGFTVEHFDLFRIESVDDLESTGFWDVFSNSNGLIIIEWSNKLDEFGVDGALPRSWRRIDIELSVDGNQRWASIKPPL
ncbi:MAG TPA: tRNA (adenosine(37)-N6)-threonylcarbamoyltransferase complex ATPase subunit type 1 TsaE [Bdellovibrionales bacterium]|nr:tRNA (adenosine(37)-N6)-threonylcarbamoyltransferase complex ATPase subunit type 1 TsaE [Bdellovibrionales bacterium]